MNEESRKLWWISIEGSGSAASPSPHTPDEIERCWPNAQWAEQIIGLPTQAEQQRLHGICLTATIAGIEEEMAILKPRMRSGEIIVVTRQGSRCDPMHKTGRPPVVCVH